MSITDAHVFSLSLHEMGAGIVATDTLTDAYHKLHNRLTVVCKERSDIKDRNDKLEQQRLEILDDLAIVEVDKAELTEENEKYRMAIIELEAELIDTRGRWTECLNEKSKLRIELAQVKNELTFTKAVGDNTIDPDPLNLEQPIEIKIE